MFERLQINESISKISGAIVGSSSCDIMVWVR